MIQPALIPTDPPRAPRPIDPNAPALADGGLYGLAIPLEEAKLLAIPVPYDATCSSRHGTLDGPRALIDASGQVDLWDPVAGEPWRSGVAALPESDVLRAMSEAARKAAERARAGDDEALAHVDRTGAQVEAWLADAVGRTLDSSRVPFVLGGEHGVSFGAFGAAAERHAGLGILQIDAHADLRLKYEGFVTSHASIMRRTLELDDVGCLVQVGLRDLCREEAEAAEEAGDRVAWFTDAAIAARCLEAEPFAAIADEIVERLPDNVWISFDIDGLDPSLCPGTGTPVPGGLTWREACYLLAALGSSGKRIVGADLVEIGPSWWDGFVAAKLLYLLMGVASGTAQRVG